MWVVVYHLWHWGCTRTCQCKAHMCVLAVSVCIVEVVLGVVAQEFYVLGHSPRVGDKIVGSTVERPRAGVGEASAPYVLSLITWADETTSRSTRSLDHCVCRWCVSFHQVFSVQLPDMWVPVHLCRLCHIVSFCVNASLVELQNFEKKMSWFFTIET
jgi:hypothetical protein